MSPRSLGGSAPSRPSSTTGLDSLDPYRNGRLVEDSERHHWANNDHLFVGAPSRLVSRDLSDIRTRRQLLAHSLGKDLSSRGLTQLATISEPGFALVGSFGSTPRKFPMGTMILARPAPTHEWAARALTNQSLGLVRQHTLAGGSFIGGSALLNGMIDDRRPVFAPLSVEFPSGAEFIRIPQNLDQLIQGGHLDQADARALLRAIERETRKDLQHFTTLLSQVMADRGEATPPELDPELYLGSQEVGPPPGDLKQQAARVHAFSEQLRAVVAQLHTFVPGNNLRPHNFTRLLVPQPRDSFHEDGEMAWDPSLDSTKGITKDPAEAAGVGPRLSAWLGQLA
jgi:hypothetical protein